MTTAATLAGAGGTRLAANAWVGTIGSFRLQIASARARALRALLDSVQKLPRARDERGCACSSSVANWAIGDLLRDGDHGGRGAYRGAECHS